MSARRRGATGLAGVLLVDKPAGLTSHDVVSRIRRITGEGRVGHAGTLDPMATGLLVLLIGPATRLEPYLSSASKSYLATIRFGTATDTDDAEGAVTSQLPVDDRTFEPAVAREILSTFMGDSNQMPPSYSAIKVGGTVAHRAARAGEPLELQPRPITVHEAELTNVDASAGTWDVSFKVSKGTYIRSLARDIGERAGTAAHLSGLRRTRSGPLDVADAATLEQVETAGADGLCELFIDPVKALSLPAMKVASASVSDGRPVTESVEAVSDGELVALTAEDGALRALYRRSGERLLAEVVFPHPVGGAR